MTATRVETCGRVLVVDDSEVFLGAASSIVSSANELRLVGRAASGEEAIRLLPQLRPDLVVLDVHMPGLGGVETARVIRRESPTTLVLLVSADPADLREHARSAGATAFLDKSELVPQSLDALWQQHRPRD